MSGTIGYGVYGPLFTSMQRQELEHQAMIYMYLVIGLPVPLDLVMLIRLSFEPLFAPFFLNPSGYCSYYGKKFDPEPERCRRMDGKKWRCSKDANHPDSKYCERPMHRSRNRSRKHAESQSNTSNTNTGSFQNMLLFSCVLKTCKWHLIPSQVSSSSLLKQKSDSQYLDCSSAQQYMPFAYETGSQEEQEQKSVHPFFNG